MITVWLGCLLSALAGVSVVLIVIADAALLFQVYEYFALRSKGLREEHERLSRPLPLDDALPDVVLQIPTFNEGALVERAIANAMRLDWPVAKLHIQICDDSTDNTTEIARAAAARAVAQGFDVAVFHRDDRANFKAGALQAAMMQTPHRYFAILDVDFISPPDFLRRCMTVLLGDDALAFVQARGDFLNRGANVLTRAQGLFLDYHFALEQAARSWSGQTLPFNGTGGVWRRAAIELGGGWRGETLTEDWEQSYLARLKGARGTFLTSVTAAGELPERLQPLLSQQWRWAKGIGQVAWKILPRAFAPSQVPVSERLRAVYPLIQWVLTLAFTAGYLFAIPAMLLSPAAVLPLGAAFGLAYAATFWVVVAMMWGGGRAAGRDPSIAQFAEDIVPVMLLVLYVSWARFWSMPSIVMGRRATFVRTPKRGALHS